MWRTVEGAGSAIGLAVVVPVFTILRGGSAEAGVVRAVLGDADGPAGELRAGRFAGTTWRGSALLAGPATGCSS